MPSHARNVATAPFVLRTSHTRTTPSYPPMTAWYEFVSQTVTHEGVAKCAKEAAAAGDARISNRVVVRSVDTASALCPSGVSARSRNGFSAALYKMHKKLSVHSCVWGGMCGRLTMVCSHTPYSVFHFHRRTVESKAQLAAFQSSCANSPFDTRSMCDLGTRSDDFRRVFVAIP